MHPRLLLACFNFPCYSFKYPYSKTTNIDLFTTAVGSNWDGDEVEGALSSKLIKTSCSYRVANYKSTDRRAKGQLLVCPDFGAIWESWDS